MSVWYRDWSAVKVALIQETGLLTPSPSPTHTNTHTHTHTYTQDLKADTDIDLENIVYYKDDTHYFVMTAKKDSLLRKGVLKNVRGGREGGGRGEDRREERGGKEGGRREER